MAKKYELADQTTSFFDPATGYSVTRDQVVALGDKVGKKTQEAIKFGRLVLSDQPETKGGSEAPAKTATKAAKK